MKKTKPDVKGPSRTSLREMPEVDFARYRVRRNRFARRIAREGFALVHDEPTRASLRAIPEADFSRARVRRNPYAAQIRAAGVTLQVGRGRPNAAAEVGPTVTKSVRLPPAVWARLAKRARAEGVAVHALVRRAILELVDRAA
jgi:hypothetical protein